MALLKTVSIWFVSSCIIVLAGSWFTSGWSQAPFATTKYVTVGSEGAPSADRELLLSARDSIVYDTQHLDRVVSIDDTHEEIAAMMPESSQYDNIWTSPVLVALITALGTALNTYISKRRNV